jgi:DNA-binding response OmpR family regulator
MSYILVAEDDPHIQLLIQRKLEIAGHTVKTTNDGGVALDLALTTNPDLIILDIQMPTRSGLEVCNAIKQQLGKKSPPIIILSARGQSSDVAAGESVGADDYMIKPFSPADLLATINRLLGKVSA